MAFDIQGMIQSAPQVLRDLPFYINMIQLIFYAGLVLTFGGFVMKAFRGYLPGHMIVLGRIVFGFLALITGIGISWLIPAFSEIFIFKVLQVVFVNIIIGGIIASIALYAALRMASYHLYNIPFIKSRIQELQGLEEKAKKVEKEEKLKKQTGIRHPVRLAGVVVLAVFLVIGLVGFQGFPNTMNELGLSEQELNNLASQLEKLNEQYGDEIGDLLRDRETVQECAGAVRLLQDKEAMAEIQPYTNDVVKGMVENYTGEEVLDMFSIESDEDFYVLAMTESKACLSSLNTVCVCQEVEGEA